MDYKKYSLEQLENWMYDAMSCGDATPQEIYDVIIEVVKDNYYTYKKQASEAYELLSLLNGNGKGNIKEFDDCVDKILSCDKDDPSPECKDAWNDFWEDSMPPWGHSDLEALRYTEEELNAMCDKAASDEEKEKCREYNLRESEYYNKRAELDAKVAKNWKPVSVEGAPVYVSEDGDVFVHDYYNTKEDKVVKWQLPVDVDGLTGDCFVEFPDDLLERAGLKEGDLVEWVDRNDGSFELRKVNGTK
jgi:hypothetical protein